jgi:hypothetical protein
MHGHSKNHIWLAMELGDKQGQSALDRGCLRDGGSSSRDGDVECDGTGSATHWMVKRKLGKESAIERFKFGMPEAFGRLGSLLLHRGGSKA